MRADLDWYKCNGNESYVTIIDQQWNVGKKNSGLTITVPAGFEFESSVPSIFKWILSPHDPKYLWAACIHDYLLENGYRPAFAAGEWYDGALHFHAPKWKTLFAYILVSLWTIVRRFADEVG